MTAVSLMDRFDELNGFLLKFSHKNGVTENDAHDVVQTTWSNVFNRIHCDEKLFNEFEKNHDYFKSYIFKALRNQIINYFKKNAVENKRKRNQYNSQVKEEDNMIKPNKNNDRDNVDDLVDTSNDPDKPIVDSEAEDQYKNFIEKLKEELTEEEAKFIELYLDLAEQNINVNISEIARLMNIKPTKGHDIFKRIRRIAESNQARDKTLEMKAMYNSIFAGGIFDILLGVFGKQENANEELVSEGKKISSKILDQLGVDAIKKLSKII